ncbi:hypothetical protein J7T55_014280 [Diaporthe amygdali]|uniref:uncharacterized protein n=1 Tax=Phomopsis amygdali TaxID=1214568 RepID=UPI0022FE9CFF|nr:uncharacterized protein J7T55_014280 [Diaporthe amygdali]KAJ0100741.1 hypothetical protein J7T55_014280 [Diaporthe amygdali]
MKPLSSPLPGLSPLQSSSQEDNFMFPTTKVIRSKLKSNESPCGSLDRPFEIVSSRSSSAAATTVESMETQARSVLGGSSERPCSESGLNNARRPTVVPKKKMFQLGDSSEEDSSVKTALKSRHRGLLSAPIKQGSSPNSPKIIIKSTTASIHECEGSCFDECAIDNDDNDDWEDSNKKVSSKSVVGEKRIFFRGVIRANHSSGRSLITSGLESIQSRGSPLQHDNMASESTSPLSQFGRTSFNSPPWVASPEDSDRSPLVIYPKPRGSPLRSVNETPGPSAQPIPPIRNAVSQPIAFSPRTIRRNMMSTELTESLRRHILWERSQKTSTANAVLKRRHTSQDVANLSSNPQQSPGNGCDTDINSRSWDQGFTWEAFAGYHTQGW